MNKSAFLILIFFFSSSTLAGVIDFETSPDGNVTVDEAVLANPYIIDGVTVEFGFDTNGDNAIDTNAVLEDSLDNAGGTNGFANDGIADNADTAADKLQLGDFFLRQQSQGTPFGTFIINYTSGLNVTAASGEIWDIDGNSVSKSEEYTVTAWNNATLLDTIVSPEHITKNTVNDLSGKAWEFGFSGLSNITQIRIDFTGTKTNHIGLAFNNFSPVTDISIPVPAPASLGLLLAGLFTLLRSRRAAQLRQNNAN
jgi:hypothetical protein